MRRREFITLLGGAARVAACGARAAGRAVRRIGVLCPSRRTIRRSRPAFRRSIRRCRNWAGPIGRNLRIDYRWGRPTPNAFANTRPNWSRSRRTSSWRLATPTTAALQAGDPHRAGCVCAMSSTRSAAASSIAWRARAAISLALPVEYSISGKWLELLKEIAPRVTRVAVLRDPASTAGTGQFGAIQAVAPSFGVELRPVNVRDAGEIERAVTAFARLPNGGLIVTASGFALTFIAI